MRALIPALSMMTLLAACGQPSNTTGEAFSATGELIALSGGDGGAANACFACHGLDGMGDGDSVPRLAGLDVGYLQKQMEDYASDIRHDPVMTPIAGWLDDRDRRAVAQWYADMPVANREGRLQGAPDLYANGDAARGVVACAACHGAAGQGGGPGNPALAGQPQAYLVEQMRRWRTGERRNDPRGVMAVAVADLTDREMTAIAAWLSQQSPAQARDSGAASASVSASAAAEPAASRALRRPDQ